MTNAEIQRALRIRELLLDETSSPDELHYAMRNNSLLLARVIEYYCAAWQEVEIFEQGLRVVPGCKP